MKERVATFERRSEGRYQPSAALRHLGKPLGARDSCPTLFRYPGPEGLTSYLRGGLSRLGSPDTPWLWLADKPSLTSRRAAALFGVIAVLEPLRLAPCLLPRRRGHYLAENREVHGDDALVWVPPGAEDINWDRIRTPDDAIRRLGRGYAEAREKTLDALSAYLEELKALARTKASPPFGPWCAVTRTERRRVLAEHDVEGRWTR